jgi:hypothetical protein
MVSGRWSVNLEEGHCEAVSRGKNHDKKFRDEALSGKNLIAFTFV